MVISRGMERERYLGTLVARGRFILPRVHNRTVGSAAGTLLLWLQHVRELYE